MQESTSLSEKMSQSNHPEPKVTPLGPKAQTQKKSYIYIIKQKISRCQDQSVTDKFQLQPDTAKKKRKENERKTF